MQLCECALVGQIVPEYEEYACLEPVEYVDGVVVDLRGAGARLQGKVVFRHDVLV